MSSDRLAAMNGRRLAAIESIVLPASIGHGIPCPSTRRGAPDRRSSEMAHCPAGMRRAS
jgi:hypothetical protein